MFRKSKDALRRGQEEAGEEGVPAGMAECLLACRKWLLLLSPVVPTQQMLVLKFSGWGRKQQGT